MDYSTPPHVHHQGRGLVNLIPHEMTVLGEVHESIIPETTVSEEVRDDSKIQETTVSEEVQDNSKIQSGLLLRLMHMERH
jgi:hypothetical protein